VTSSWSIFIQLILKLFIRYSKTYHKTGEALRISKKFVRGGEPIVSHDSLFCLGNPVPSKNCGVSVISLLGSYPRVRESRNVQCVDYDEDLVCSCYALRTRLSLSSALEQTIHSVIFPVDFVSSPNLTLLLQHNVLSGTGYW
jgi:hypothetical protein